MVMPGGSRIPATVRPRPQMFLSERKMSKKKRQEFLQIDSEFVFEASLKRRTKFNSESVSVDNWHFSHRRHSNCAVEALHSWSFEWCRCHYCLEP